MTADNYAAGSTGAAADVLEIVARDHREVEQLFRQFETADPSSDIARATAERIIRELSVHAVVEEEILYPALREVGGGDALADHALEEHQELKETLASVDGKPVSDPSVRANLARVRTLVERHVGEEERDVFSHMRALGEERLMRIGTMLETAKKTAPTHPHPNAPNTPPGNVIAGMAAAVVDRMRDALRSVRT